MRAKHYSRKTDFMLLVGREVSFERRHLRNKASTQNDTVGFWTGCCCGAAQHPSSLLSGSLPSLMRVRLAPAAEEALRASPNGL